MNIVAVLWEGRVLDLKKNKRALCFSPLETRVTRHFDRTAAATYRSQARLFFVFFSPTLSVPGTLL